MTTNGMVKISAVSCWVKVLTILFLQAAPRRLKGFVKYFTKSSFIADHWPKVTTRQLANLEKHPLLVIQEEPRYFNADSFPLENDYLQHCIKRIDCICLRLNLSMR